MQDYARLYGAIQARQYDMGTQVATAVQQGASTALLTGEISWEGAIPAIAGAIAAIMLPDNSGAQAAIKDAATAVVVAEQATVNSTAKATIAVGIKAPTAVMALLASGFGLGACAAHPTSRGPTVADVRSAYAAAHAAEMAYAVALDATPARRDQLAILDEAALAALAAYDAAPGDTARSQAAEIAVATLAAYGAARAMR